MYGSTFKFCGKPNLSTPPSREFSTKLCLGIDTSLCFLEILASTNGSGPYCPRLLIILRNILRQICSRAISKKHAASGAYSKQISDVIKQNQSELGNIDFEIEPNKAENVFCFLRMWSIFALENNFSGDNPGAVCL